MLTAGHLFTQSALHQQGTMDELSQEVGTSAWNGTPICTQTQAQGIIHLCK
jgi:hypothetical protein